MTQPPLSTEIRTLPLSALAAETLAVAMHMQTIRLVGSLGARCIYVVPLKLLSLKQTFALSLRY
jgi:hypothetical protein